MGKLIEFTSRRCGQEYQTICLIKDQAVKRELLEDWKRRYKILMKSTKKIQNNRFWARKNKL